LTERENRFLLT